MSRTPLGHAPHRWPVVSARPSSRTDRVAVSGIPIDLLTVSDLEETIYAAAGAGRQCIITYANVHVANLANRLPRLRSFLWNDASIVYCDGLGLLLGARVLGARVQSRHRMTAPDFFDSLAAGCAARGLSLYLLAGVPGVAATAGQRLKAQLPALRISCHDGYFAKNGCENDAVLSDITLSDPDILCVGFGSPLQERWVAENRLALGDRVVLLLGAWLDFYSGVVRRGPRWMTDNGLEWVSRLCYEPRRLWSRYLIGNPRFLARVLWARARMEFGRLKQ